MNNHDNVVHIYNRILHSYRNDAITQFAATWMEMEDIVLNEVSQKDKYRMISFICDITA